jgi:hypothetical protein
MHKPDVIILMLAYNNLGRPVPVLKSLYKAFLKGFARRYRIMSLLLTVRFMLG